MLAFHHETVEAYVRRRHSELKLRGAKNVDIFTVLRDELADHLVAAPDLSERQLRRIIGKYRCLVHVALFQAYAMTVFEVDGRYEQHGYLSKVVG